MEQSGCNQWQAAANGIASKSAETSQTVAWVATSCHGKERVDGSSPSEGLRKWLQMATLVLSVRPTRGHIPDTLAVRVTHRGVSRSSRSLQPGVTAHLMRLPKPGAWVSSRANGYHCVIPEPLFPR
jgi:hypothetical protein